MMKKRVDVVCAIIKEGQQYLVCLRKNGAEDKYEWEFPGGKIENGETIFEAIKREMLEELQVVISPQMILEPVFHQYSRFSISLTPVVCDIVSGNIKAQEHEKIKWTGANELLDLKMSAADIKVIKTNKEIF